MMWDNLMHPSTLWLISPVVSLLINGLVQTFSYRFLKSLLLSELVGFVVGLVTMLIMSTWIIYSFHLTLSNYWAIFCVNLIIFIAMQIWFSNVLGIISIALRVRILRQIDSTRQGPTKNY